MLFVSCLVNVILYMKTNREFIHNLKWIVFMSFEIVNKFKFRIKKVLLKPIIRETKLKVMSKKCKKVVKS